MRVVTGSFVTLHACLGICTLGLLCALPIRADGLVPRADALASPLEVVDLAGHERTLDDYRGRTVLVNFWASWCPPCLEEMPSLERLRRAMAGRPFAILAVNVGESASQVRRFARLEAADIALLRDPQARAAALWDVTVYPTSVLIDAEGRVRDRLVGPVDWDTEPMMRRVESLLPQ